MEAPATINKTKWALDKLHSEIGFKVKHLMISNTKGVFKEYTGTVYTEGDDFTTVQVELWIDPASINTRDAKRDEHLKNEDFFDVERFRDIRFRSTKMEKVKEDEYALHGDFTMKGITRPIRLEAEFNGIINDPWGGRRTGFVIKGKISRKDWGLTWSPVMETGGLVVGDEISITCEIELIAEA